MSLPSQRFFRPTSRLRGRSPHPNTRDFPEEPSRGLYLHYLAAKESLVREAGTAPGFRYKTPTHYGVLAIAAKQLKLRNRDSRAKAFVILYNYAIVHMYNRLQKKFAKGNSHSLSFDEAFERSWGGAFGVLVDVIEKRKLGVNFIGRLNHASIDSLASIREQTNASSILRRRAEPNLHFQKFLEADLAKVLLSHASPTDAYVIRRRLGFDGHPEEGIAIAHDMKKTPVRISRNFQRGLSMIKRDSGLMDPKPRRVRSRSR